MTTFYDTTVKCSVCGHEPSSRYLAIPETTTERRKYIPIGFLSADIIASNKLYLIENASYFLFGLLTSNMHMAWMRTIAGRLKSDPSYSPAVYNTFPFPTISEIEKKHIEELAENVLLAREMHPDMTLADMYDPNKMPDDLQAAHAALDLAVDSLYRKKPFESDEERLQLLFQLYEQLIGKTPADKSEAIEDMEEEDA